MALDKPQTTLDFLKAEAEIPMSEKKRMVTETVNIEHKIKDSQGTVDIDFLNSDELNSFVDEKTKVASEKTDSTRRATIDEIKGDIKTEESAASNYTAEEMYQIAEVIMGVIDMGISTGLRFWSGDSSDSAYSLPAGKKNMLVKQMTMILVKYQFKFKIEFMFLLSLIVVYSVPFMKARDNRRIIQSAKKQSETIRQKKQAEKIPVPENAEILNDNEEETEIIIDAAQPIQRRGVGTRTRRRPTKG